MFVMLVGIPASGKSTRAEQLRKVGFEVISSDDYRESHPGISNRDLFDRLHEIINEKTTMGKDVVFDATNLRREFRIDALNSVAPGTVKVCELFMIDPRTAKYRNALRRNTHGVTDDVIDYMCDRFQIPTTREGFGCIQTIVKDENVRTFQSYPAFHSYSDEFFLQEKEYYACMYLLNCWRYILNVRDSAEVWNPAFTEKIYEWEEKHGCH